jgi:hypothetical protein
MVKYLVKHRDNFTLYLTPNLQKFRAEGLLHLSTRVSQIRYLLHFFVHFNIIILSSPSVCLQAVFRKGFPTLF